MSSNSDRAVLARQMRTSFQPDAENPGGQAIKQWTQLSNSEGETLEMLFLDLLADLLHLASETGERIDFDGDSDALISSLRSFAAVRHLGWAALTDRARRIYSDEWAAERSWLARGCDSLARQNRPAAGDWLIGRG